MSNTLSSTKAPNLQVPPQHYDFNQQSHLVSQLRLYFTQVDNTSAQVVELTQNNTILNWFNM